MKLEGLLAQLMLYKVSIALVAQTCVWKDGSLATDFLPCANSTATTGSCCLKGESCLGSGLCYGSIGLVYRGACINTWGGDCPTYCDDISDAWANLLPCPFPNTGTSQGPQSFWCGAQGTTACTASNHSHFVTVLPQVATKILTSTSAAPVSSTTGSLSSPTASSSSSQQPASATASPLASTINSSAAIGVGVTFGVLLLASVAFGVWAFRLYRRQKEQYDLLKASMLHQGDVYMGPSEMSGQGKDQTYPVYRPEDAVPHRAELSVGRAELGDR